jgi:hypothetical protein
MPEQDAGTCELQHPKKVLDMIFPAGDEPPRVMEPGKEAFDLPATPTAPAFTINGFTDIAFSQSRGWALRASAKYQVTRRWSLEPYYLRWHVSSSPVNHETVTFTVNNVTAHEQLGAYEPLNGTNEFGVRLGFHF